MYIYTEEEESRSVGELKKERIILSWRHTIV